MRILIFTGQSYLADDEIVIIRNSAHAMYHEAKSTSDFQEFFTQLRKRQRGICSGNAAFPNIQYFGET